ncbi:formylglycine-generating enzyme family protein [bacterium]|nr:formylglycine-generating enzyme family protein [bacterium]
MKNTILFGIAVLFCISAFCDECWSDGFRFDGSEITEEAILLKPTDPLAYSSALAEGEPKSLTINVEDTFDPEKSASIFADYSETAVEGTSAWDYTDEDFKDFPTDDTYFLTETVTSDTESKVLKRTVTILPEPVAFLALAFIGVLFLRKHVKSIIAILALIALGSLGAKAEGIVSNVNCLQMWPFDRSVIINYTLTCDSTNQAFKVKFYGSLDNGATTFDLAEKGTLSRDGSDGIVEGSGEHKTFWTPDESFYETYVDEMKVKVTAKEKPQPGSNTYMVIDLSGGTEAESYPITYLDDIPDDGWTDEYKTTKLVLRKIKAGTFSKGSPESEPGREDGENLREITLTKDYYIGIFETTQKQYELITGNNPSKNLGDMRPVERVSFDMIRGAEKGAGWPHTVEIDDDSILGKLRAKTGIDFDLPTEAQWEYACRAGTTTALNNGTNITDVRDDNMDKVGRYLYNQNDGKGGYTNAHTTVGSYLPNAWGLYDMHGNVEEWCLDWFNYEEIEYSFIYPLTDPVGPSVIFFNYRGLRGGGYLFPAHYCRSAKRAWDINDERGVYSGFRLALTMSDDPGEGGDDLQDYMVVDIDSGDISYLDEEPEGGWTDDYKTSKMVFRKVKACRFTMGSPMDECGRNDLDGEYIHEVTLSKPYYIGVFETTQKQYELIAGDNPSKYQGDLRPVENVSFNMIRGSEKGVNWPYSSEVDEDSFMGKLRAKTGKAFDLPTEAQWECACRAGTSTAWNDGTTITNEVSDGNLARLGRYQYNREDGIGGFSEHTIVGSYLPNAWGIYDMHGNVYEYCLDLWDMYDRGSTDPKGASPPKSIRIIRGGSFDEPEGACYCRSAHRFAGRGSTGFRVVLIP